MLQFRFLIKNNFDLLAQPVMIQYQSKCERTLLKCKNSDPHKQTEPESSDLAGNRNSDDN